MRGLYLAEGAMLVQQAQLQVISNNMANLRTTGFKQERGVETSFAEWMIHELRPVTDQPNRAPGHPARLSPPGQFRPPDQLRPVGSMAHNVATQETVTSFIQGPLEVTNRRLDFAIFGNGFFQVQGEDEILYTRNGRFYLNSEGVLTTIEGYEVIGEGGPIQPESEDLDLRIDGTILVNGEEVGRLEIAVFDEDALLERFGYNYFRTDAAPGGEEDYELFNGILEGSNVNLAREMTALMMVRRTYEAAQKIMITYDQLLDKAANELGSSAR